MGLDAFLTAMKRQGNESGVVDIEKEMTIEKISTGIPSLDDALGGGIAVTSVVEFYGFEQTAKTSAAIMLCAKNAHSHDIVWFDYENSFNEELAQALGFNVAENYKNKTFALLKPTSFEKGEQIIETLLAKAEKPTIIVVDSLAFMTPQKIVEGGSDASTAPILSKKLGPALARWMILIRKTKSIIIFINHKKELLQMSGWSSGAKLYTTPGGRSLKFAANVRLDFSTREFIIKTIGGEKTKIGQKLKITVTKNRISAPHRFCEVSLVFGKGLFTEEEIRNNAYEKEEVKEEEAIEVDTEEIASVPRSSPVLPVIDTIKRRGRPPKTAPIGE